MGWDNLSVKTQRMTEWAQTNVDGRINSVQPTLGWMRTCSLLFRNVYHKSKMNASFCGILPDLKHPFNYEEHMPQINFFSGLKAPLTNLEQVLSGSLELSAYLKQVSG